MISNIYVTFVLKACLIGIAAAEPVSLPPIAAVKEYVQASMQLGSKRMEYSAEKTDELYSRILPILKSVDGRYGTEYQQEIRRALDCCLANDKVEINAQVISKGLQHVTVQAIRQELDNMSSAKKEQYDSSFERLAVYFEHIRPTFARRDSGFYQGQKTLEKAADDAINRLSKSNIEFLSASQDFEDAIARTIALSVLYEMTELEKFRDSDPNFCDIKKTEAAYYYRIIQPRIERRSPRTGELILRMLNGNYGAINTKELEIWLSQGLSLTLR